MYMVRIVPVRSYRDATQVSNICNNDKYAGWKLSEVFEAVAKKSVASVKKSLEPAAPKL